MVFSAILTFGVFAISLPCLYLTATSARLLLQYEDLTKKAAKLSGEADRQLWKTRKTQGAALVVSLSSTLSAGYLLLSGLDSTRTAVLCFANAISLAITRTYVAGFWSGAMKSPVPGSTGYNDAIRSTEQALTFMALGAFGWILHVLYALVAR